MGKKKSKISCMTGPLLCGHSLIYGENVSVTNRPPNMANVKLCFATSKKSERFFSSFLFKIPAGESYPVWSLS